MKSTPLLSVPSDTDNLGTGKSSKHGWLSFWKELFADKVLQDLLSPVFAFTLMIPFAVGFVGVVVAGNGCLLGDFSKLLSVVLFSEAMTTFSFALFSQYRVCTDIDFLSAIFLGQVGKTLVTMVGEEDLLVYILISQALLSAVLGASLCLLAKNDGLWFLRFLPYPVSSGFAAGIGIMIMDGGFELGTGIGLQQFAAGIFSGLPVWHYVQLALTCISAAVFLALKLVINNALRLPLGILITTGAVHFTAYQLKFTMHDLVSCGMMLEGLSPEPWSAAWSSLAADVSSVDWGIFVSKQWMGIFVPYIFLHIILWSFYVSGFEDTADLGSDTRIDLNTEVHSTGWTNIMVGLFSGVPTCHSYKMFLVMKTNGGQSRIWVLLYGTTFAFLFFEPAARQPLAVIPKLTFGGLVLSMGIGFIRDAFAQAQKRIAEAERRIVGLAAFAIYLNVLLGLGLGCFLMMVFFIIEYSGITGVTSSGTLETVRSLVERSPRENATLMHHGNEVAVFWCSGYIFFGTASTITEEIDSYLWTNPQTRVVIIDFEYVPAVDASGVHLLMKFASRCKAQVCICGMVRRLSLAFQSAAEERGVCGLKMDSRRVEQALRWAEGELLMTHNADGCNSVRPQHLVGEHSTQREILKCFMQEFAHGCPDDDYNAVARDVAVELRTHSKGTAIFTEGEVAEELMYVIKGQVVLSKATEPDDQIKLPRYHLNEAKGDLFVFEERASVTVANVKDGSLLGAMEFGTSYGPDTTDYLTTATAEQDCQVLVIPFIALQEAFQSKPSIGFAFMKRIGWEASVQVMRLVGNSHLKPYRIMNPQDRTMKRALSWASSSCCPEGPSGPILKM